MAAPERAGFASRRDFVHYALIVGAPKNGRAVEMFPRLVEDQGASRFGAVVFAIGEAMHHTVRPLAIGTRSRSEEHTSELQSQSNLVCRLLLEKKKPQPHAEAGRGTPGGARPVHARCDRRRMSEKRPAAARQPRRGLPGPYGGRSDRGGAAVVR